jgi:hypothetical protein
MFAPDYEAATAVAGTDESVYGKSGVPELQISGRFVTMDPTGAAEPAYDEWTMTIKSSGETENDYCPWLDYLSKGGSAMQDREYKLGPRSESDARKEIVITEIIGGLPELRAQKPTCGEILRQTFDMQLPDGTWKELWNHHETAWLTESGTSYPETQDHSYYGEWKQFYIIMEPNYYKLYVQFSQDAFESEFQVDFATLAQTIEVPVRLATRDGRGEPIDSLTIAFNIAITGSGDSSECASQEVMFDSSARDLALALPQNQTSAWEQWAYVWEPKTLAVKNVSEDTAANCTVAYALYIFDENIWKPIDQFRTDFNADLAPESLAGSLWFDRFSADLSVSLPESDIDRLRARFGDELRLRVYARVAGS